MNRRTGYQDQAKALFLRAVGIVSLWGAYRCGPGAQFGGTLNTPVAALATSQPGPQGPQVSGEYTFHLDLADGAKVVSGYMTPAMATVRNVSEPLELSAGEQGEWSVKLMTADGEVGQGALGRHYLNLEKYGDFVQVDALFTRAKDGKVGKATQTIFIDTKPPRVALITQFGRNDSGVINWTVNDNYEVDPAKTRLIACLPGAPEWADPTLVSTSTELSSQCTILAAGEQLTEAGSSLPVGMITINGVDYSPRDLQYIMGATDRFGQVGGATSSGESIARPMLDLVIPVKQPLVSKDKSFPWPIQLTLSEGGRTVKVHEDRTLWPLYQLKVSCDGAEPRVVPMAASLPQNFAKEGPFACRVSAERMGDSPLVSNTTNVTGLIDVVPPVITGVRVEVPSGFLEPTSQVRVTWSATDNYGQAGNQRVQVRPKGSTDWLDIASVPASDRSVVVTWGDRPNGPFEVRIVSTDLATNSGVSSGTGWSPPFFNSAVLTSSVNCFFCHMRIEGDMAGINFPASIHGSSGENFQVTGKIYATGLVPAQLRDKALGGAAENYKNQELRVFPTSKDASGVPVFPKLEPQVLEAQVNGILINGDGTRYSRVINGPLTIVGTQDRPFEVNGEVYVRGNLIIKGYYKGQGSIYATNVLIVDDIVSADCTAGNPNCPFPFTGTEAEKLAKAREAVRLKRASLHLGATEHVLVGDPDNALSSLPVLDAATKAQMHALGRQAFFLKLNGADYNPSSSHIPSPTTDGRVNIEVNRVDAYLYGHQSITFRAYGNILINGGFMGYEAHLVTSYPYWLHHRGVPASTGDAIVNPRNGLSARVNVVRYDYRLRVGGPGFESLKRLFAD